MTRDEFAKELADDEKLRNAVNQFNRAYRKHYGPKRWPVWAVIFLVVVAALVAIYAVR